MGVGGVAIGSSAVSAVAVGSGCANGASTGTDVSMLTGTDVGVSRVVTVVAGDAVKQQTAENATRKSAIAKAVSCMVAGMGERERV